MSGLGITLISYRRELGWGHLRTQVSDWAFLHCCVTSKKSDRWGMTTVMQNKLEIPRGFWKFYEPHTRAFPWEAKRKSWKPESLKSEKGERTHTPHVSTWLTLSDDSGERRRPGRGLQVLLWGRSVCSALRGLEDGIPGWVILGPKGSRHPAPLSHVRSVSPGERPSGCQVEGCHWQCDPCTIFNLFCPFFLISKVGITVPLVYTIRVVLRIW